MHGSFAELSLPRILTMQLCMRSVKFHGYQWMPMDTAEDSQHSRDAWKKWFCLCQPQPSLITWVNHCDPFFSDFLSLLMSILMSAGILTHRLCSRNQRRRGRRSRGWNHKKTDRRRKKRRNLRISQTKPK